MQYRIWDALITGIHLWLNFTNDCLTKVKAKKSNPSVPQGDQRMVLQRFLTSKQVMQLKDPLVKPVCKGLLSRIHCFISKTVHLHILGWVILCGFFVLRNWFFVVILLPFSAEEKTGESEGWVVSSESCCFQSIGAKYYREVQPGEIVQITKNGVKTLGIVPRAPEDPPAFCIFEYVYFSRPDSIYEGKRPGLQIRGGGGGGHSGILVYICLKNMV